MLSRCKRSTGDLESERDKDLDVGKAPDTDRGQALLFIPSSGVREYVRLQDDYRARN